MGKSASTPARHVRSHHPTERDIFRSATVSTGWKPEAEEPLVEVNRIVDTDEEDEESYRARRAAPVSFTVERHACALKEIARDLERFERDVTLLNRSRRQLWANQLKVAGLAIARFANCLVDDKQEARY